MNRKAEVLKRSEDCSGEVMGAYIEVHRVRERCVASRSSRPTFLPSPFL